MKGGKRKIISLLEVACLLLTFLVIASNPLEADEYSDQGDFEIYWSDPWMEDNASLGSILEPISYNFDSNQNHLYYLGDKSTEIELSIRNNNIDDIWNVYITLAATDPIIAGVPDNRWPSSGDYGNPGTVFSGGSPGEWIDDNPVNGGLDGRPWFTIDISTEDYVNTLYTDALALTINYEDLGGPDSDTFYFDIYISSIFDQDNTDTSRDIHDDLPDIEETDAHLEFEPGQNMQEGELFIDNYADFDISDVEGTISNLPIGIELSGGVDTSLNRGLVVANGGNVFLYWNFDIATNATPGYYSFDIEIGYNRSDNGEKITEYYRSTGLHVAASTFVTGPVGGPTNVAGITITYNMTGSPSNIDLYYTTDTGIPYSWTFMDTDSTPDGSYDWSVPADGSYGWIAVSDNETAPNSSIAPEASYYIYDGTQPDIVSTDPIHNTTDIAIDYDIIITFSERMNTNSVSYSIEPDPGGLSENWENGNKKLTLSHTDFTSDTKYTVFITAGKDVAGNDIWLLTRIFYFYTAYIPSTATAYAPTSGPVNIPNVSILYTTTENPESVQLFITTNNASPFTWTLIGEDSPADGSFDWTLPSDGHYGWYVVSPDETTPGSGDSPEASYYIFDDSKPEVLGNVPEDLETDISLNQNIEVTFSEPMDTSSVNDAFSYTDGQTTWDITQGTVLWNTNQDKMIFTPTFFLGYGVTYTVTIGSNAKDIANNTIQSVYKWSFSTEQAPDTIAPLVSSVSHIGDNVEVGNSITIMFSEAMNHSLVEDSITISGDILIQDFSWVGTTLTITFADDMDYEKQYTVTIGTGAEDEAGNSLIEPYNWTFTTKEKEKEDDTTTDSSIWFMILIIFVVVFLIALLLKSRNSNQMQPENELEQTQEEAIEDNNNNNSTE